MRRRRRLWWSPIPAITITTIVTITPVSPSSYLRIPLSHPCRYGFREQKRKEWGPRICNECNTCRMLTTQVGSMN